MKHFAYIINIWILALTAVSCTNEELTDNRLSDNKDPERTVTLNFAMPSMTDVNISRAAVAEPIEDLLVFVFDEKGDLMTSNPISFNKNELTDGSNGGMQTSHYPALGQYATTGWVRFPLNELSNGGYDESTRAQIYLVGNAEYLTNNSIFTEETFTKIQSAKTFTALTKLICEYQTEVDCREDHFLLAGAVLSYDGGTDYLEGYYLFPLAEWKNYTINLFRTDAKVDFEISSSEGCTFTPTSYQVCNAPKKTYLFWQYYIQQGGTVNDSSFKDVFNKDAGNNKEDFFDTAPIELTGLNQFTFYIGENLKRCQKTTDDSNLTEKAKLNRREKHTISENGEYVFTNAPELGTYVILKGTFEGSSTVDEKKVPVKAEVSYIIHLGFRNKANNTNPQWGDYNGDVNDYITKRNYHYTYHIMVKGVNDIVTEVTDGKENMSAAEGEVTIEEEVITLTNNAPTATITLKKSESVTLAEEKTTNTAWITVEGEPFNDWISKKRAKEKYSFTANTPEEEVADRQIVLLATRTSSDGRSKIIRRITVKQTVS